MTILFKQKKVNHIAMYINLFYKVNFCLIFCNCKKNFLTHKYIFCIFTQIYKDIVMFCYIKCAFYV